MKIELDYLSQFAKGTLPSAVGYFGKNCVVYTRVSSKEQADTNKSLEWQKSTCEKYAADNGMNIVGYFGGTYESAKSDERKEFNRMIKFVKQNKAKVSYIIVYSLDRFSRTGESAIYISSELKKSGINILSATQQIDVNSIAGHFHQGITFMFGKFDNDSRRQKSVEGMRAKLKRGEWIGVCPIGYSYVPGAKEQTIIINEKGKFIKEAFIMRAAGLSYPEIIAYLSKHNIHVYKQMLSKMFRNPFYRGFIAHNLLEGKLAKGKHEALVDHDLFLRANGIKKLGMYTQKKANAELPLKGFVTDYSTDEKFTGYLVKKKGLYYYKVNKKGVGVNRSQIMMHDKFIKKLDEFAYDPKFINVVLRNLMLTWDSMVEATVGDRISFTKRLEDAKEKLSKVEERFAIGEITLDIYTTVSTKMKAEISKLESEIKEFEFQLSNPTKLLEFAAQMCSKPSSIWASGDYYHKQRFQKVAFPDGIQFDAKINEYRTKRVSSIFVLNARGSRAPSENEEGTPHQNDEKSLSVPRKRLELSRLAAYAPQAYLYTIPTPGHSILLNHSSGKH